MTAVDHGHVVSGAVRLSKGSLLGHRWCTDPFARTPNGRKELCEASFARRLLHKLGLEAGHLSASSPESSIQRRRDRDIHYKGGTNVGGDMFNGRAFLSTRLQMLGCLTEHVATTVCEWILLHMQDRP